VGWIDDPVGQLRTLFSGTATAEPPPPDAPPAAQAASDEPPLKLADLLAAGVSADRASVYLDPLNAAMLEFKINTPIRAACFLATVAWESEEFKYTREIWGPTKEQSGYEGRRDLGNTQPGDGFRFRGAGLIETTGRNNHQAVGGYFGIPLDQISDWMQSPVGACRSAALFWYQNGLNRLADNENDEAIRRKVNGGLNGYVPFLKILASIKQSMGLS